MTADPALASFLRDRAASSRPCPDLAERIGHDQFFHHGAISIELALKSYLIGAGVSDDWLRDHVGHDLNAALRLAAEHGLAVPVNASRVIVQLHPYFMEGGFHHGRRAWPAELVPATLDMIDALICEADKVAAG